MLTNKLGRLLHVKCQLTATVIGQIELIKGTQISTSSVLITLLLIANSSMITANDLSQSTPNPERELISYDLELDEIGVSNRETGVASHENPKGMNSAAAKIILQAQQEEIRESIRQQFCDQAPTDQLCNVLPNDNTDFSALFVYMFLTQSAQNSFDVFSWQSFIALNWPISGSTDPGSLSNSKNKLPRTWSQFKTPQQIFNPDYNDKICGTAASMASRPTLTTANYIQPSGRPLIDRNLNYLVYDVRVNDQMADYVKQNTLDSLQGQKAYLESGKQIEFPIGYYDDPSTKTGGATGSVAIKTAWMIVDTASGDKPDRFFTIAGLIPITAAQSESGVSECIEVELALVGMHIMRRTESGNGKNWIWSTFEHVDNAPLAQNIRRPNGFLQKGLLEGGCKAPASVNRRFSLFSEKCLDCPTNELKAGHWKWSSSTPYARNYGGDRGIGSQVVRCWDIFTGTELINNEWQQKLQGTVWANYQSISAQWKGANRGNTVPEGEVPRFMTNTTMETYDQISHTGSCLSCHAAARSAAGQSTGFSFLLGLLPRYQ